MLTAFLYRNENLEVVKGNIFEADSLVEFLNGQDAVMSYLGVHNTSIFNPTTLYSESMKSIMTAMERLL
jgi:putative NADH-flavin reductase